MEIKKEILEIQKDVERIKIENSKMNNIYEEIIEDLCVEISKLKLIIKIIITITIITNVVLIISSLL